LIRFAAVYAASPSCYGLRRTGTDRLE
jgi:hypothetical protein